MKSLAFITPLWASPNWQVLEATTPLSTQKYRNNSRNGRDPLGRATLLKEAAMRYWSKE
jgi:hypothetical protein